MNKLHVLVIATLLFISSDALAAGSLTNKDLAGTWKIADVKITSSLTGEKSGKIENCYFYDLYKAKLGLVFTADGKIDYSNYGNPVQGRYEIAENLIYFFTDQAGNEKSEKVEFTISLNGQALTLSKVSPSITETYTFTK
jgi:hypothetical protein